MGFADYAAKRQEQNESIKAEDQLNQARIQLALAYHKEMVRLLGTRYELKPEGEGAEMLENLAVMMVEKGLRPASVDLVLNDTFTMMDTFESEESGSVTVKAFCGGVLWQMARDNL